MIPEFFVNVVEKLGAQLNESVKASNFLRKSPPKLLLNAALNSSWPSANDRVGVANVWLTYEDDNRPVVQEAPTTVPISVSEFLIDPYHSVGQIYDSDWDPITKKHTIEHEYIPKMPPFSSSTSEYVQTTSRLGAAVSNHWESEATWVIIVILFPVLLALGTIGNFLTFVVLQRKTFTDKTAARWLFKRLAVMCTICLWAGLPRHWCRAVYGVDIRQLHIVTCTLHRFTLYCAMDITTWLIVSISADRLIAVLWPFKAPRLSTGQNAKRVFLGLCAFFALFNIHILFTYGRKYAMRPVTRPSSTTLTPGVYPWTTLQQTTASIDKEVVVDVTGSDTFLYGNKATVMSKTSLKPPMVEVIVSECQERNIAAIRVYNRIIHPWMSLAIYVIGPFIFMLFSNIVIARKLASRRRFLKRSTRFAKSKMSDTGIAALIAANQRFATSVRMNRSPALTAKAPEVAVVLQRAASSHKSTTILLFAASIEFLVTAVPAFFLDVAEKPMKKTGIFDTPKGLARFQLLYTLVRLLLFSNFALHFFLFCLSAQKFRNEVFKVVCCFCRRNSKASLGFRRALKSIRSIGRSTDSSSLSDCEYAFNKPESFQTSNKSLGLDNTTSICDRIPPTSTEHLSTSPPATLSNSTGCQTMATSKGSSMALAGANSTELPIEEEECDDGCYDGIPSQTANDAVAKATLDLANIPPPPELCVSVEFSPEVSTENVDTLVLDDYDDFCRELDLFSLLDNFSDFSEDLSLMKSLECQDRYSPSQYYNSNPLLVTVINSVNSGCSSNTSLSPDLNNVKRHQSLRILPKPPLARLESAFFGVRSRNSLPASSKRPRPIYSVNDANNRFPFSRASFHANQILEDPNHNFLSGLSSSVGGAWKRRGLNQYYLYPTDEEMAPYMRRCFSLAHNRHQNKLSKRESSIMYVYLSDPTSV